MDERFANGKDKKKRSTRLFPSVFSNKNVSPPRLFYLLFFFTRIHSSLCTNRLKSITFCAMCLTDTPRNSHPPRSTGIFR
jgi:hypothetical protein